MERGRERGRRVERKLKVNGEDITCIPGSIHRVGIVINLPNSFNFLDGEKTRAGLHGGCFVGGGCCFSAALQFTLHYRERKVSRMP